jgi:AcrR family transcriptional regulator
MTPPTSNANNSFGQTKRVKPKSKSSRAVKKAARKPRAARAGVSKTRRYGPHAVRSAATRRSVLDAAIKCLFEHGYGGTSTVTVAEEAGVSRGAMMHQFPSKADLMTFVVEAVFEEDLALYHEMLADKPAPRERVAAYPLAAWTVMSRPAGVAVLEIFQGSRSDKELTTKLAATYARIDETARSVLQQELHRSPSTPLMHLVAGAVRGLSITQVIAPGGEDGIAAIRLLQQLIQAGIETGVLVKD